MCFSSCALHHVFWPTWACHSFSFLNSLLNLAVERLYQRSIIPILDLLFKICPSGLISCVMCYPSNHPYFIKSPQSGVTLCFRFVSAAASASAAAAAMTFASEVKTVKYRSGTTYWVTFGWPWRKVTAVTFINKKLLVCRIKWEPLNQSLLILVAISPW